MGLTFDTGALIALERRSARMRQVWDAALAYAVPIKGRTRKPTRSSTSGGSPSSPPPRDFISSPSPTPSSEEARGRVDALAHAPVR